MKAKPNPFFILAAVACLPCMQANAVTVVAVTDAGTDSFATSVGTAGATTAGAQSTTQLVTYQISGLDLAEDMSANDTLTVSILISATGGNVIDDINAAGGEWGVTGWVDAEIDPGEGLSFALDSFAVAFGDAPGAATITFDGFTGLSSWYTGGGDVPTITGATIAPGTNGNTPKGGAILHGNGGNATSNFDALAPSFSVDSDPTAGNGYYLGHLDFQLTATPIPEPSAALLGGLGLLGLLRRRK
ncbi:MAG: PEP-CTERM sorting domain-containing protein [Roseibacillus sp.]